MTANVTFFPVDNGDMTLIKLADAHSTILIDCKIRAAADAPDDPTCDVASELRNRLGIDNQKRPYVDAFLLSHPDEDHCLGLEKHFWLGSLDDYPDDDKAHSEKRIVIRELWSSPMIFRRFPKDVAMCSDAQAFRKEAKRRVKANEFSGYVPEGDRLLILGEDKNGKTDSLAHILVKAGETREGVNQTAYDYLSWKLIGPLPITDDASEEVLSKNGSSVIINFAIKDDKYTSSESQFLTGGDAGVEIWEKVWNQYSRYDLEYDLLLAPHHCSWRTLSHDSWSEKKENAKVSPDARSALEQAKHGAFIVSSSKPIEDDDNDPPCIRAKREYKGILGGASGLFRCTGEEPSKAKPKPLCLETSGSGFNFLKASVAAIATASSPQIRAGVNDN